MPKWNLSGKQTAAVVAFTLCFLGLIAAAERLYESVLPGLLPEPLAHGLKIFGFALIFLYPRNALSGILGRAARPRPASVGFAGARGVRRRL